MASNIFNVPSTGTSGTTTISATTRAIRQNVNGVSTLSVSDGNKTLSATLTQYFKPKITRSGSGTIAGSGGTMSVAVSTPYEFWFRNVPNNIGTITSGGVDYKNTNPISSGTYAFSVDVLANNGQQRTDYLEMAFQKINGTYSYNNADASDFKFAYTQESGSTIPAEDMVVEFGDITPDKEHQIDSYTLQNGVIEIYNGANLLKMIGVNGDASDWYFQGVTTFAAATTALTNATLNVDFGRMSWNDFMYPDIIVDVTINNDVTISMTWSVDTLTGGISGLDLTRYASGNYVYLEIGVSVRQNI